MCLYGKNDRLCIRCLPSLASLLAISLLCIPKCALTLYIVSSLVLS